MMRTRLPPFKTERVAYWFFRLNGCMSIVNFLVHHEKRGQEGTEIDILAVRYPHRQELALSDNPMRDDPVFDSDGQIDLILSDATAGPCKLNEPWINPEKQNMERVLHAVGVFPQHDIDCVAKALYDHRFYENAQFRVRFFAIGRETNRELSDRVVQLTWDEILAFIYKRFEERSNVKSQHRQWDWHGRQLYSTMQQYRTEEEFVEGVRERLKS